MPYIHKELEEIPTHEQIQRCAYELYLKSGEEFSAKEYWLIAEEELRREHNEPASIKSHPFAIRQSETSSVSDRDYFAVVEEEEEEEEELSQVRASEELKKEREESTLPRTKTVSVGQQKQK